MHLKQISAWLLLILIVIGFSSILYFHGYEYLSFSHLSQYHRILIYWTNTHYLLTVLSYLLVYTLVVALSIPGALFLTLLGGFLFGPVATIYVLVGATAGATILFFAVRSTLGEWLASKANGWVLKMKKGFQQNAFNYLLVLRLVPFFPFWAVNIVAALLSVPFPTFVTATLIGIIPATFIYVMVGNSLSTVLNNDQTPNLNIIFTPPIFLPLLALAVLALLPVIYKWWKGVR